MSKPDRLTSQLTHIPTVIGKMGISIAEAQKDLNADYIETLHRVTDLISRMLRGSNDSPVLQRLSAAMVAEASAATTVAVARVALADATDDTREAKEAELEVAKTKHAEAKQNLETAKAILSEPEIAALGNKMGAIRMLLEAMAPSRYQYTEATLDFSADLAESFDLSSDIALGAGLSGVTVNAGLALSFGYDYRAAARMTAKLHAINANESMTAKMLERADAIDQSHKGTLPANHSHDTRVRDAATEAFTTLSGGQKPLPEPAPADGADAV